MTQEAFSYQVRDDENGFGPVLVLGSDKNLQIDGLIKRVGARSIRLSESMGWNGTDLSALELVAPDSIEALEVYSSKISDLSVISRFRFLRKIGLQTKNAKGLMFSDFPRLEVLFCNSPPEKMLEGVSEHLRILKIDDFSGDCLDELPNLQRLQSLTIYGKRLKSLSGIERYVGLLKLEVGDAVSLSDIESIKSIPNLKEIKLHRAMQLSSLGALSECCSLRRLELEKCGEIESLVPLAGLRCLEELVVGETMSIRDRNLAVLAGIPSLRRLVLAPRRGYTPSVKEIRGQLATRKSEN